jgi:chitinase
LLALLKELRAARPNIILTIPVGWINANFPGDVDAYYKDLAATVDQMNIMSYGMSGNWGWLSWHSSALMGEGGLYPSSIDASVKRYLEVGVPAAKLGVGTGFYGQCWSGVTQPRASLDNANEIANDNDMSFTNIRTLYQPNATRTFDAQAKVPYLSSNTPFGPLGCNYISYEDEESIALKGKYIHEKGLGGTIIWTINQGYLPNAPVGQHQPLMQAMKESILQK